MTPKEALEDIKTIDIVIDGCKWNYKDTDHKESVEVIEQALTELEELKQEVIARQETENSLTQWVADLTTELEELKRDVKRFMELMPKVKFRPLQDEVYLLQQKLLKVGKEE